MELDKAISKVSAMGDILFNLEAHIKKHNKLKAALVERQKVLQAIFGYSCVRCTFLINAKCYLLSKPIAEKGRLKGCPFTQFDEPLEL